MGFVETERRGQVMVIRMNRPERLNALGQELRAGLAAAWREFRDADELEIAVFTGTGRAWRLGRGGRGKPCSLVGQKPHAAGRDLVNGKPVIGAVNGFAMGGGFQLVERTDLRVAVQGAVFEISEAKRWLLGGYNHGFLAGLPHPIATEMALGFRFTAERLYQVGFLNRLVAPDDLLATAFEMAEHMLTLPPAARVNTVHMMRQMRPRVAPPLERLAAKLHEHGAKDDLMESRRAFAEKRKPNFKGWNDPADRHRLPAVED